MDLGTLGELKDRLCLSGMGRPALVGIAAVIALVAVVVVVRLGGTADAGGFEISRGSADAGQSAPAEEPSTLFVHVSGAVKEPGLYEVPGGARVADAVNAAGGFADDAERGSVNLARTLEDGEQIVVAAPGVQAPAAADAGGGAGTPAQVSASGLVNVNTASAVELVALPGIGEATAAKIVADRDANGPFKAVEDLKRVPGIGDKKYEALAGLICV